MLYTRVKLSKGGFILNTSYTYENFETAGVLTLLDPLFTSIAVFSLLLIFTVRLLKPPAKLILIVSAFTIILSAQLFMIHGILLDELNLIGSSKATLLFGLTIILQLVAIGLAFWKAKADK